MRPSTTQLIGKKDLIGAEIGVYEGKNAVEILKLDIKKLYLVDPYRKYDDEGQLNYGLLGPAKENALKLLGDGPKVQWHFMTSLEFTPNEELDFIYIDADHRPEFLLQDMEYLFKFLKVGGMISGHDWDNAQYWDVPGAVNKFAKDHDLTVYNEGCDWWIYKK